MKAEEPSKAKFEKTKGEFQRRLLELETELVNHKLKDVVSIPAKLVDKLQLLTPQVNFKLSPHNVITLGQRLTDTSNLMIPITGSSVLYFFLCVCASFGYLYCQFFFNVIASKWLTSIHFTMLGFEPTTSWS